ncbi:MAG: DNA-3-methyladenine glycosylase 2 family protein [Deltaproteobacteria bacterium]|nr:DNA-3-methyladenine glycosylase 2 family protein [Deltaproteobacteria bacterium]MDQ3296791.1 DNA-3-methyladenine glycosylase 2 family protein [Myxococcota bacterium]
MSRLRRTDAVNWSPALAHLADADPRILPLIERHGPPTIQPTADAVQSLARAIVGQQLSGKAAATIWGRVLALYPRNKLPPPAAILATPDAALRGAGLSGAKTAALKDLARHVLEKWLVPRRLPGLTDAEVAAVLLPVRGIGPWSVDMFLMFALARPDVLPVGDLGIRKGMQLHFGLRKLPEPDRMLKLALPWQPYRTVASWYMWRLLEPATT